MPEGSFVHHGRPTGGPGAVDALTRPGGDRIAVALDGHCSIAGGPDLPCTALDLALGGATLQAVADPEIGAKVKLAFAQTGILASTVIRRLPAGFAVAFDAAPSARFLRFVNWLRHGRSGDAGGSDGREHARIIPLKKLARLTRENGEELLVRVIDVSRSGIAVERREGLLENERVKVGEHDGTVVRFWGSGAAIAFDEVLGTEGFDITICFA